MFRITGKYKSFVLLYSIGSREQNLKIFLAGFYLCSSGNSEDEGKTVLWKNNDKVSVFMQAR